MPTPTTPSPAFLAWWAEYKCKRRVKRLEAWQQWQAQGCEAMADEVMAGLERFKRTDSWPTYAPEAPRWLKHRRWEDDPVEDDVRMTGEDDGWAVGKPILEDKRGEITSETDKRRQIAAYNAITRGIAWPNNTTKGE